MAPQYLSTDPRAGLDESTYLSTDPTAGDEPTMAPSHEAGPKTPERDWGDTATDLLPMGAAIAGGLVGAVGGPAGAIAGAGLAGAGGQALKRIVEGIRGRRNLADDTPLSAATDVLGEGAIQAGAQAVGLGAGKLASHAGRGLMRMSLGAQKGLRAKFPTVDLERVALREGTHLGTVSRAARTAHQGVRAAASAADEAGAARIQPREITRGAKAFRGKGGLRDMYDEALRAREPEEAARIVSEARGVGHRYRGGLSVTQGQAAKKSLQRQAKGVLQGSTDPRSADVSKRVAGELSRGMTGAVRARGMGPALDRSQELMALEKALTSSERSTPMLRTLLGAASGASAGFGSGDPVSGLGAGVTTALLTSPRGLALAAQGLTTMSPAARESARAALVAMLERE